MSATSRARNQPASRQHDSAVSHRLWPSSITACTVTKVFAAPTLSSGAEVESCQILPLFADFNIAQSRSVSFWVVMQMVGDHDQLDKRAESVVSWRQVRGMA